MKGLREYSKGRFSTFLFSMLSAIAFFGGALITIYVAITNQDEVITELLTGHLRWSSYLAALLGKLLAIGIFCFLLALLFDFIRHVRISRKDALTSTKPPISIRILNLILTSAEEQENIIGDLLEEYDHFPAGYKAYLWIFKQAATSPWPLLYGYVRYKLLASIGEWIRRRT